MDIAEFTVMQVAQNIARPKGGTEILIEDASGREFGGVVAIVTETQNAVMPQLDYEVQCRDYSYHLTRRCAVEEYAADTYTYSQILTNLVQIYGTPYGITAGTNVQPSFQSDYQRFDYLPVDQCLTLLAEKISWTWYVDYYKSVWFFPLTQNASPLPGNTLYADSAATLTDPQYGQLGVYGDLQIAEDVSQMKTRVYLHGQNVTADYTVTQTWTGDGSTKTFGLSYEPSHTPANVTVTVGGQTYAVEADIVSGAPNDVTQDKTAYINYGNLVMRFNVAPASGVEVKIVYYPMLPLTVTVNNPADEAAMALRTGDDGIFEYAISDPTLSADTIGPAQARGQFSIAKYGTPHISGQFTSWLHGWRAGQSFTFKSLNRFDGELDGETLYVTKVERQLVTHPETYAPLFQSTVYFSDSIWVF